MPSIIAACRVVASVLATTIFVSRSTAAEFTVDKSSVPGRTFIILQGPIIKGDLIGFQDAIEQAASTMERRPTVVLASPGGSYFEGLLIGLEIHRRGLPTGVLPDTLCASACSLIFFAGTDPRTGHPDRTTFGDARIGVHRSQAAIGARRTEDQDNRVNQGREQFYNLVHVSRTIREHANATPSDQIYYLTKADMLASDIAIRSLETAPSLKVKAKQVKPATQPMNGSADRMAHAPVRGFMMGYSFLKAWKTLLFQRIRIVSCTLLPPHGLERPCSVYVNGTRVGSIMIDEPTFDAAGAKWAKETCADARPRPLCAVTVTGEVQEAEAGPIIKHAVVEPMIVR